MFSDLGLTFYDGPGVLKVLREKKEVLVKYSKSCVLFNPMACSTGAREQELQRAILTTPQNNLVI